MVGNGKLEAIVIGLILNEGILTEARLVLIGFIAIGAMEKLTGFKALIETAPRMHDYIARWRHGSPFCFRFREDRSASGTRGHT